MLHSPQLKHCSTMGVNSTILQQDRLFEGSRPHRFGPVMLAQPSLAQGARGAGRGCTQKAAALGTGDKQKSPLSLLGCEVGSVPPASTPAPACTAALRLRPSRETSCHPGMLQRQ